MIRVKIGISDYELKDVSEDWLNREINGRRKDGVPICVQITVRVGVLNLVLTTPACGGGGGGRPPTPQEKAIFDRWNQLHLNSDHFTGGNVIAFLKQLQSLI